MCYSQEMGMTQFFQVNQSIFLNRFSESLLAKQTFKNITLPIKY